jgi:hypothetical protein
MVNIIIVNQCLRINCQIWLVSVLCYDNETWTRELNNQYGNSDGSSLKIVWKSNLHTNKITQAG